MQGVTQKIATLIAAIAVAVVVSDILAACPIKQPLQLAVVYPHMLRQLGFTSGITAGGIQGQR